MAEVNFTEQDAERLLRLLREHAVAAGLTSADESAVAEFSGLGDLQPATNSRERVRRYVDSIMQWVAAHSTDAMARVVRELNEQVKEPIQGVRVRMPGTRGEERTSEVDLDTLLIPSDAADAFKYEMQRIRVLVYESRFPGPDLDIGGPGEIPPPTPTPRGPGRITR